MRFVFHSLSVCLALFATSTRALSDDSAKQPVELTDPFGMKFRLIRAGEFVMGSPRNGKHRGRDEGPRHTVRITRPFYLGVHEVTQGNWKEIMGTKPWNGQEGDKIALSCVSWNDAQAFINKLNAQSDKYQYRRHLCLETQGTAAATPPRGNGSCRCVSGSAPKQPKHIRQP